MGTRRYPHDAPVPELTSTLAPTGTPTAAQLLDFEAKHSRTAGITEQLRQTFGITPTRYYQLLNRAIDDPAGLAHDPITTNRLHRQREARTAIRNNR